MLNELIFCIINEMAQIYYIMHWNSHNQKEKILIYTPKLSKLIYNHSGLKWYLNRLTNVWMSIQLDNNNNNNN